MLIRLGYDIELEVFQPITIVGVLNVHPSRTADLLEPDRVSVSPTMPVEEYQDTFGNTCTRLLAQPGTVRLTNSTLIKDSGDPDPVDWNAPRIPVQQLPPETLQFLLASRYCEVDSQLGTMAWQLFGHINGGWPCVQAICDWVNQNVTFGYHFARPTKTATDVAAERNGVCRDFQHLAITLCRCMNIPARYCTGYLGDIGVPPAPCPMDFSAWFQAYLGGQWWTFDARHNVPRIGRVLMATGRDAADVAITTSFGTSLLKKFIVITDEVTESTTAAQPAEEVSSARAY